MFKKLRFKIINDLVSIIELFQADDFTNGDLRDQIHQALKSHMDHESTNKTFYGWSMAAFNKDMFDHSKGYEFHFMLIYNDLSNDSFVLFATPDREADVRIEDDTLVSAYNRAMKIL